MRSPTSNAAVGVGAAVRVTVTRPPSTTAAGLTDKFTVGTGELTANVAPWRELAPDPIGIADPMVTDTVLTAPTR